MSKNGIPKPRHHKASGLAIVEPNGRRCCLGKHGTPKSEEAYRQRIAEWMAAGRQLAVALDFLVVVVLTSSYLQFAQAYYRKPDGRPTSEINAIRYAVSSLLDRYSHLPCREFTPKKAACHTRADGEAGMDA